MLLGVLPHELGHHRDAMTTRSGRAGRGEPFAERYAGDVLDRVWPIYTRHFAIYAPRLWTDKRGETRADSGGSGRPAHVGR
jgi:hypothetical protein